MSIGENMRRKRNEYGLTQQQLAERVHIDASMIARIESGSKLPGLLLTKQLAEQLHCTVDELISDTERR